MYASDCYTFTSVQHTYACWLVNQRRQQFIRSLKLQLTLRRSIFRISNPKQGFAIENSTLST